MSTERSTTTEPAVRLRRIESPTELGPAVELVQEYGDWALARAAAEYGAVPESTSLEEQLNTGLDELLEERSRLYIAEIDAQPAGVVGFKPITRWTAEIKRLYVRPEFRGHGVARRLLQRLIDDARALGYRRLLLETTPFMPEAQALYRNLGFVDTRPYEGSQFSRVEGAAEIETFMKLDLPALDPPPG